MYKTPRTAIKHLIAGADFSKKIFDEMRHHQVVCMCAVRLNPSNYDLVGEELKNDPEILEILGKKPQPKKPEPEVLIQVETKKEYLQPAPAIPEAPKHVEVHKVTPPVQQEIKLEQPKAEVKVATTSYPYAPVKTEEVKESAAVKFLKKLFGGK